MKIFKGDDTGGRLGKALTITVHTKYDLTDCLVFFNYQGITRKWEGVKDGDTLDLFFSHNETARMSVGTFKGIMFAVDPAGKYRTIDNAIPITVTTSLRDCYGDDHFDVVVGVAINWDDIVHKPFEGQEIDIGTDDKVLAALGTIIEKLGGTVKAGIALVALCAMSALGYTPETHTNTFVRNGVTYAQRGGMNATTYVVTNIDMTASDVGAVDTNAVRDIAREEITPATNRLNQTLSDALDDKRDKDDLNVYFRELTGRENWTLKRDSQEYELEYVSEGYWKHDYTEPGFYDYIRIRNGTNFEYGENVGTGEYAMWYDDYNQLQEHPEYIDMSGMRTYVSRTPQGSMTPTSDRLATTNGVNAAIAENNVGYRVRESVAWSGAAELAMNANGVRSADETRSGAMLFDQIDSKATKTELAGYLPLTGGYLKGPVYLDQGGRIYTDQGGISVNTHQGLNVYGGGSIVLESNESLTDFGNNPIISATNPAFSNAVLAVGLNIDTNSVAVLNEIASTFGGFPVEGTATTVGGLLAALAAAAAWLKKNKVQTLKLEDNSVETSADGGVAKLDDFFTESNSLLTGTIAAKLPYPINTDGTILDRNVNVVTSGAFVLPEGFKDLLIRYTGVPVSLTFSGTDESIADWGDDLPTESGDYLITVTRIAASECYIRIIELKERA